MIENAKHPAIKDLLTNALAKSTLSGAVQEVQVQKPIKHQQKAKDSTGFSKITNYAWEDSGKFVKLYITSLPGIEEVTSEKVNIDFKPSIMELEVRDLKKKGYILVIQNLFGTIKPEESSIKVRKGSIIISLKKEENITWTCLTATEKQLKEARQPKTPKMKEGQDPGASIMELMKNMYQEGDDDMKRTIAKAWTESQEKKTKEGDLL